MRTNVNSIRNFSIGGRIQRSSMPRIAPYLFLLPQTLLVLIFVVHPLIQTGWLSLNDWVLSLRPTPTYIGLENYIELFKDPLFHQALKTTIFYVVGTTPPALAIGLAVAIALNQPLGRIRTIFRTAFFVPVVVPTVVVALIWVFLFDVRVGLVNTVISGLGITPPNWFADVRFALITVVIASIWQQIGFAMIIFLAGLQAIPGVFYEAASVDGANKFQRFLNVTLPLLAPTAIFALITSIISGFKVFDQVFVMTGGGPANSTVTLVYYLYIQAFEFFDVGRGTAAAMTLLLILAVLTLIILRVSSRRGGSDDE